MTDKQKKKQTKVDNPAESHDQTFHLTAEQRKTLNLSEDILKALSEVFTQLDVDGNGELDASEMKTAMAAIGVHPTDAELNDLMKELDTDNNGTIDFFELAQLVSKKMGENDPERELREAFKAFDIDGDGFISADEIRTVAKTMGQELTEAEIEKMMKDADENNDGQLDYSEFVKCWFGETP